MSHAVHMLRKWHSQKQFILNVGMHDKCHAVIIGDQMIKILSVRRVLME